MRGRTRYVAYCGPGGALLACCAVAYFTPNHVVAGTELAVGFATGWCWPLWALRRVSGSERPSVVGALNVQLSILVGLAVGALLLLVFIGVFVFLGLGIAQIVWCIDSWLHLRRGEDPPRRRYVRAFVH